MALSSPYLSMTQTRRDISATVLQVIGDHRKAVGARLRDLRKSRGLSQEDAAARVGVTLKTWGDWERGKRDPYDGNWRKIGEAFDVDPAEIRGTPPAVLGLGAEPPSRVDHLDARVEQVEQSVVDVRDEFRGHIRKLNKKLDEIRVENQQLLDEQSGLLGRIEAALADLPAVANGLQALLQRLETGGLPERRAGGGE